ncbi:MAG TPA: hypothetical protein VFT33_01665 [Gaiellaceae bacterium]|nr:hypothetical protein [Gaiellaceae bacterium]
MRRHGSLLAAAGLATVGLVGALVVVAFWDGGGSDVPEPTVASPSGIQAYADLDTYSVHFGDTVTAKVEVTLDRARVDPDSVRVRADFTPWKPIGPPQVVRRDGRSTTYVETRYTLRCLESFCTTPEEQSLQGFPPARVGYTALGAGDAKDTPKTVRVAWPQLLVKARYAPPSASQSASQSPTRWQADLLTLPAATYRIGPWGLTLILLGLAALLAAAAVAIVLRTRPRPTPPVAVAVSGSPGIGMTPLEYALELLEDPARVNGSGDQRRALELVADGLVHRGDGVLGRAARALAWSRSVPKIDETRSVARRARAVFGKEADAPAR